MLQFLVSSLEKVSSLDRNKQEMNTPLMERQRATERGKKNVYFERKYVQFKK